MCDNLAFPILSGLIASVVTAFVTKSNAYKKNALENITQERKKWRDDMRSAVLALRYFAEHEFGKDLQKLENPSVLQSFANTNGIVFHSFTEANAFFVTRLNPSEEDYVLRGILKKLPTITNRDSLNLELDLFEKEMSKYLKYEWEKAKYEVGHIPWMKIVYWFVFIITVCSQHQIWLQKGDVLKSVGNIGLNLLVFFLIYMFLIHLGTFLWKKIGRCRIICSLLNVPCRKGQEKSVLFDIIVIAVYLILLIPLLWFCGIIKR